MRARANHANFFAETSWISSGRCATRDGSATVPRRLAATTVVQLRLRCTAVSTPSSRTPAMAVRQSSTRASRSSRGERRETNKPRDPSSNPRRIPPGSSTAAEGAPGTRRPWLARAPCLSLACALPALGQKESAPSPALNLGRRLRLCLLLFAGPSACMCRSEDDISPLQRFPSTAKRLAHVVRRRTKERPRTDAAATTRSGLRHCVASHARQDVRCSRM